MLRKTLTILSLIGLLLSVGLWGLSYFHVSSMQQHSVYRLTSGAFIWDPYSKQRWSLLIEDQERVKRVITSLPRSRPQLQPDLKSLEEALQQAGLFEKGPGSSFMSVKKAAAEMDGIIASLRSREMARGWRWSGFRSFHTYWCPANNSFGFILPLWLPTLVFVSVPLYGLLPFHRRRKRKKLGLCVKCGYDLRGSADRCPECGAGFSR